MAVHIPAFPRTDVWHGPYGSVLALLAVVLPFALVLVWAVAQPTASPATLGGDLSAAAALVDGHATAMASVGDRLASSASASSAADRAAWVAYGERMSAEATSLRTLAERLRTTAAALDPLRQSASFVGGTSSGALAAYAERWQMLRAEAQAAAAHGREMQLMAGDLEAAAGEGLIGSDDLSAIRAAAGEMIATGDRVVRTADVQLASIDRMQRGMGLAH